MAYTKNSRYCVQVVFKLNRLFLTHLIFSTKLSNLSTKYFWPANNSFTTSEFYWKVCYFVYSDFFYRNQILLLVLYFCEK